MTLNDVPSNGTGAPLPPGAEAPLPPADGPPPAPAPASVSPEVRLQRRLSLAGYIVGVLLFLAVSAWAFAGVGLSLGNIFGHVSQGAETLKQFAPVDWSILGQEWRSMLDTIQMAVVGTLLGAVVAVPVSFFAARTTSFARWLASLIKILLNIFRATPIVVYAIILAAMVGLGKPTGALAIMVGTFVMLTKLYAEALESVAQGPVEAVRAAGGNLPQTCVFGMLPQVFPGYVSSTLYAFELNLQASFILGFVGAGGIGYDLLNYTRLFQWQQVSTVLILTIVVVNVVDFISYRVRSAIS